MMIHESAYVDLGAQIGEGTKVWHFCHIMGTAVIGQNCSLGQNTFVGAEVCIGHGVKVQNNVSIFTGVQIEDNVFLGPSCVFTNVINPRASVVRKNDFKRTLVKNGASIGANATILCGVTIGQFAFVGAGSVVTKDVPDFALVIGNPAVQNGWMSPMGIKMTFDEIGQFVDLEGSKYQFDGERVKRIVE
jgi:UDP-2-acetamido-3-amino-2,3-dideoxy-glucuronate N-acetyltransferase